MPNHVINEIIFRYLSPAERATIRTMVRNAAGDIDFDILVPTPKNVWLGNVGTRHEQAFGLNALQWSRENWGTKWNAYGIDEGGKYVSFNETNDGIVLTFQTAWRPPYGWIVALFNFTKLSFDHNWLDEGCAKGVAGRFDYAGLSDHAKEPWWEKEADADLQKHLHKLLWGVEEFPEEPDDEAAA